MTQKAFSAQYDTPQWGLGEVLVGENEDESPFFDRLRNTGDKSLPRHGSVIAEIYYTAIQLEHPSPNLQGL